MTPERWRQLDDLFDEALRLDPAERDAWLRWACGDDEGLRAEVARLLDRDEWAAHNGFLTPPEPASGHLDATGSWHRGADRRSAVEIGPLEYSGAISVEETGRFEPKAAICRGAQPHTWGGARSLAQQRLRESDDYLSADDWGDGFLEVCHLRDPDPTQAIPYAIALAALGGIVSILSLPRPLSPSLLQVLELGMIGMLAAVFAFAQYHAMLDFSLRDDPVRAQLVMKNRVLFTAILILSYGIYVPKGWRRAPWSSCHSLSCRSQLYFCSISDIPGSWAGWCESARGMEQHRLRSSASMP